MTQAKHLGNACSSYALSAPICTPPCGRRHAPYTLQHTMHTDHARPVPTVARTCDMGGVPPLPSAPALPSASRALHTLQSRSESVGWCAARRLRQRVPPERSLLRAHSVASWHSKCHAFQHSGWKFIGREPVGSKQSRQNSLQRPPAVQLATELSLPGEAASGGSRGLPTAESESSLRVRLFRRVRVRRRHQASSAP